MPSTRVYKTPTDLLASIQPGESVLVINAVAADPETGADATDELTVLTGGDSLGNSASAFLVYGVTGSERYAFFDLNKLPESYGVEIVVRDTGTGVVHSRSLFSGTLGNQPQSLD
jgi:hypothetical protein